MNKKNRQYEKRDVLDMVEEAIHCLRCTPLPTLAFYYIGAIPFILGLCYFWADMSRSPFAFERCGQASMGLAFLFIWMRCWQALFCYRLHAARSGSALTGWSARDILRLVAVQTGLASTGFLVLPLAGIITLPFAWTYAFYQNLVAMYNQPGWDMRRAYRHAKKLAMLWPRQNHGLLLVLFLFGCFVFLNIVALLGYTPFLLKTLLGIESRFTESVWWIFNTTFLSVALGLAYLCIDPLVKTCYTLRCFYGDSMRSGQDIISEWRSLTRRASPKGVLPVLILFVFLDSLSVQARHDQARAYPQGEDVIHAKTFHSRVDRLDISIDEVSARREYTWRMPRDMRAVEAPPRENMFTRFADSLVSFFENILRSIFQGLERFLTWLGDKLLVRAPPSAVDRPGSFSWLSSVTPVAWILLAVMLCLMAGLLWRGWKQRQRVDAQVETSPADRQPDLEDEEILADQLPKDEWISLAAQLIQKGEYRQGLRAYFLAGLSLMSRHRLLSIAPGKSNRDYQRELRRTARRLPELPSLFAQNVHAFEKTWYGFYPVSKDDLDHIETNINKIQHSCSNAS